MSGLWRRSARHDRRGADHARAGSLAAARLIHPLLPADSAWLETHLAGCESCRLVSTAYERQSVLLRGLAQPTVPRDLWPRTAAALDRADRSMGRRSRGAVAARSLGALPDAGWAAGGRPPVPALGRRRTTPALLAAALVLAVALGGSLATGFLGWPQLAPVATPMAIEPATVAWVSRESDGTYALRTASFDRVCPRDAMNGCAPLDAGARTLMSLPVEPAAVILANSGDGAVVVDVGAGGSTGGAIYAVAFPTLRPSPAASPSAGASSSVLARTPSLRPSASLPETPSAESPSHEPSASASSTAGASVLTTESVAPVSASPSVVESAGTAGSLAPTAATTLAILEDVVLVGKAASYSADGEWFAFSARPADGSQGPDIYVWQVGEPRARALTDDHSSIFAAWLGDRILASGPGHLLEPGESPSLTPGQSPSSGPDDQVGGSPGAPGSSESIPPEASPDSAAPPTLDAPTGMPNSPGSVAATAVQSAAPQAAETHRRASTPEPSASDAPPTPPAEATALVATPLATTSAPPGSSEGSLAEPVSFVLDPATGERTDLAVPGIWLPVVDPSGRYVVFWSGTLRLDEATSTWVPGPGALYLADWRAVAASVADSGDPTEATPTADASVTSEPPGGTNGFAEPSLPEEATSEAATSTEPGAVSAETARSASEPKLAASSEAPASEPAGESEMSAPPATPRPIAPGAKRPRSWPVGIPVQGLDQATNGPVPTAEPTFLPVPIEADATGAAAPVTSWDVRWSRDGERVAVWVADPEAPTTGRLSLLGVDLETGGLDPERTLLQDAPAMAGFALGADRLAWATPPSASGIASRLLVIAWRGKSAGSAGSGPSFSNSFLLVR